MPPNKSNKSHPLPIKARPTPMVPDVDLLYQHLWRKFLNEPGVYDKLRVHLETVMRLEDESDIEFPSCSEDDFHPLSESSRISVTESITEVSGPVSLPPMSPRTQGPIQAGGEVGSGGVFFVDRNIDQVPERNICSPIMVDRKDTECIKVPVIKYFQPIEVKIEPTESVEVKLKLVDTMEAELKPVEAKVEPVRTLEIIEAVSNEESSTNNTESEPVHFSFSCDLQKQANSPPHLPTKIPIFYSVLLPTPLLSPSFISSIQTLFSSQPSSLLTPSTSSSLVKALNLPPFLSSCLFATCFGPQAQSGSCSQFLSFWQANAKLLQNATGQVRMFHLLAGCGRNYLVPDDFLPTVKDVLNNHQQLAFFRDTSFHNLHSSYLTSVVAALFFTAGAWRRRRMYFWQFAKINFHETLRKLEQEEEVDINWIEYFSYDQFYVFYVKFVSLDLDEDGELSKAEMLEYEEGGQLTRKIVDRVWQVNLASRGGNMSYWDWVNFVMAEVDKSTFPALDYWFVVLDTAADGLLTLGEMKEFYSESLLLLITGDCNVPHIVHWKDISTQIIDTVHCDREAGILSLMDIRTGSRHKFAHLLDVFINIFNFILNDENEVNIKSDMTPLQKYVIRCLNDMES